MDDLDAERWVVVRRDGTVEIGPVTRKQRRDGTVRFVGDKPI